MSHTILDDKTDETEAPNSIGHTLPTITIAAPTQPAGAMFVAHATKANPYSVKIARLGEGMPGTRETITTTAAQPRTGQILDLTPSQS
jgi:hypothetical protein